MASSEYFQVTHINFVMVVHGGTRWTSRFCVLQCLHFMPPWICAGWLGLKLAEVFYPLLYHLRIAGQTNLFHFFSFFLQDGPQRKKRKSEAAEVDKQLDILAIGTAVGSILLYSTVKGELQSKLVSYTLFITCYQTVAASVSLSDWPNYSDFFSLIATYMNRGAVIQIVWNVWMILFLLLAVCTHQELLVWKFMQYSNIVCGFIVLPSVW